VELQNIYSLILDIEPTSMVSTLGQDSLYRLLPGSIRACIRAFGVIRKWIISRIVAPKLGLRKRQDRVEALLESVGISRIRSLDPSSSGSTLEQACVRSFVEAVVTSALLSPESRMHSRAWQNIASTRGTSVDALVTLLNCPVTHPIKAEPLTIDIGWLFERMLEVINLPDVLESSEENQNMVNFEKRRWIFLQNML
jgi:GTPase-activating protein BEM2